MYFITVFITYVHCPKSLLTHVVYFIITYKYYSAQCPNRTLQLVVYTINSHVTSICSVLYHDVHNNTLAHSYSGSNQNNSKYSALQFIA